MIWDYLIWVVVYSEGLHFLSGFLLASLVVLGLYYLTQGTSLRKSQVTLLTFCYYIVLVSLGSLVGVLSHLLLDSWQSVF